MAQQVEFRSIPDYPFKIPRKELVVSTVSSPSVSFSGTKSVTGVLVGQNNVSSNTTENPSMFFTQTFTHLLMSLDHINVDGKILRFLKPITLNATYQDNMYSCQNEELDIVSMATELDDCIKDFQNEILFVWNEYGKEDDSKLTNDARELKRKILQYINK